MSTFEVVNEEDFPSPNGGPHYRNSVHQDIYDALAHLRQNPTARVKIAGGEGKRHTVFTYAQRFSMAIETRIKDGFVFIRLQSRERLAKRDAEEQKRVELAGMVKKPVNSQRDGWAGMSSGRSNC